MPAVRTSRLRRGRSVTIEMACVDEKGGCRVSGLKKVALVTGAGSGPGRATAIAFATAGAQVVVSDLSESGGQETVRLIQAAGGTAIFQGADVARTEEVASSTPPWLDSDAWIVRSTTPVSKGSRPRPPIARRRTGKGRGRRGRTGSGGEAPRRPGRRRRLTGPRTTGTDGRSVWALGRANVPAVGPDRWATATDTALRYRVPTCRSSGFALATSTTFQFDGEACFSVGTSLFGAPFLSRTGLWQAILRRCPGALRCGLSE